MPNAGLLDHAVITPGVGGVCSRSAFEVVFSISITSIPTSPSWARSQSERGLDSAEWSPEGEPEARASGKSDGTRSDRSETSGGSGGDEVVL